MDSEDEKRMTDHENAIMKSYDASSQTEHFINGQSNQVAAKRVNKLLSVLSKGIFSDNSWEAIRRIFSKLKEAGLEVDLIKTAYGGHAESQSGMPTFKQWDISIPFINNKGKKVNLVGKIIAHGAGSIEDPLDKYDITAYVTPVPASQISEEEQPEMYDAETDQFAPGPRQRPEDWQQGKSAGRKPIPSIINKAEVQKALTAISRMKHHEWRSLLDRARKNYQLFPDDGNDPDKLNLVMALQYMDEHPTQVSLDERVPAKIIKLKDLLK